MVTVTPILLTEHLLNVTICYNTYITILILLKQCLLLPQGVLYPLTYNQYFGQRVKSDTDHRSTRVLILKKKHVYAIPHSHITSLEKMNRCEYCWLYRQLFYSKVVRTSLILPEL